MTVWTRKDVIGVKPCKAEKCRKQAVQGEQYCPGCRKNVLKAIRALPENRCNPKRGSELHEQFDRPVMRWWSGIDSGDYNDNDTDV